MSTPVIARNEFQQLADVRLREAKTLLDSGLWDGAYYLTGYAVEVALKSCIIKTVVATGASFLFQDRRFSERCWTHDIERLIELADLEAAWTAATAADPTLSGNWGIAKQWSEQKRYHRITEIEAKGLYDAVSDPAHGVLQWIKTQW